MECVSTGISELDAKLSGGYPVGRAILLTGTPGARKTIFGLQFIHRSCTDDLKCVHIATEESADDLLVQAGALRLDLEHYLDCEQLVIKRVPGTRMRNIEQAMDFGSRSPATDIDLIKQVRMVPDNTLMWWSSITSGCLHMSIKEFGDRIDMINYTLTTSKGGTVLFIMGKTAYELTREVSKYSSYGFIKLIMKANPYTEKIGRCIFISKMRSTKLSLELSVFDITSEGIKIRESGTKKEQGCMIRGTKMMGK